MLTKNKAYKPKEALDADPDWTTPIKLGKGRMPKGGDEHCRALAAKGYNIVGYTVEAPASSTSTAAPVVNRVAAVEAKQVLNFVIKYDEGMYKAVRVSDGVTLTGKGNGMREVCNTCRVSLVQNHCENPTILEGVAVRIVPR